MIDRIDQAFRKIKRVDFLPDTYTSLAEFDIPLPIGYSQTNSQPSTVRLMLQWLDLQLGDTVLDVGSGSGWTTALCSFLVGQKGRVFAVERIDAIRAMGERNCQKLGIRNVSFFPASQTFGLLEYGPYNKILVSAAIDLVPSELIDQVQTGGKLIIPIDHAIQEIFKDTDGTLTVTKHSGYVFVPLIRGPATVRVTP